jgi:Zn finger protein HypA/HybF involved in hydrogenase expression
MNPLRSGAPHMRDKYASKAPLLAGETVAPGHYRCLDCEYEHEVVRGIVNLPVCPRCQGDRWKLG